MRLEERAFVYVGAFVDALARAGVRHVCFAPGSRSTPLAVMLARHPDIRLWSHLDERSAGFFALGMAKARAGREPVALLGSSGTATANFYPAVIEARYARVPLIVLTADRPHELRDVGAPQAIDQIGLYGPHVKWFVEVAPPEATPDLLRYARMLAARAAATAVAAPAGPVHLNFPFREPLMPVEPEPVDIGATSNGWEAETPTVSVMQAPRVPDSEQAQMLADELTETDRGLIICGPQADPTLGPAVTKLAMSLGFPVLADPLSHLRRGPHLGLPGAGDLILDSYDAFLRDERVATELSPEIVLRFGAMPTSKPVLLFLQRHPGARQIVVDGGEGWEDPALLATRVVHAEPVRLCEAVSAAIPDKRAHAMRPYNVAGSLDSAVSGTSDDSRGALHAPASSLPWLATWQALGQQARAAMAGLLGGMEELFEGKVFAELAALLPENSTIFAGNSMPVRDLDTFFPRGIETIRFLSNRGANGIDGVISSALGASTASDGPLVLVIGDISFYHDMNGLLAAKRHGLNATIVLVNNDGGGIFSFLPQAQHPEHFEQLFGTPHGLDFRPAAEIYGVSFRSVTDWSGFREAVGEGISSAGLHIVEVPTERIRNVALHREVWRAVSRAVSGEVPEVPA